jgi:radical SAM PhpK family P-methyltransferase
MDLLSHLYFRNGGKRRTPFHNADFIWPTITYLGTYLSRHNLTFDYVNAFQYEKDELRDKLLSEDILAVAIPTTLYVVPWPIQEIMAFVREHAGKVKIVVGGPYIANIAKSGDRDSVEQQLRAIGADFYIISSEGEAALAALLQTLKSGGDLAKVDNLAYRDGDRYVFTKTSAERNSLVDNMVDYSLFPRDSIGQFVSTRTAKSCPFACSFCNFPQQAGDYTYAPVDAVERELNAIRDIGSVNTVTFIDDTFNVPKKRFIAILEMMIRNEYHRDFKWNCTLRSDHCDDEIISLMARSGCEGVFLGVESGSDRMLKAMNKTATRADYLWAIPRLKEEGILAHANVFIGFPGETLQTVEETVDLIRQTRPETFSAQPWYANPLTPIWNKRDEHQIKGSSFKWSHKTMDAATACDLVDRIFLTVDDSIFLPQYGFFQWSLFYLQRQDMGLDSIKNYLRAFNELVREKIVSPTDERLHARLVTNLEASVRFGNATPAAPEYLTIYSGAARLAAESYWVEAFKGIDISANGRALEESLESSDDVFRTVEVTLPTALGQRFSPATEFEAVLAAYTLLIWQLDELRQVLLLLFAPEPLALVLNPRPEIAFAEWVVEVRDRLCEAKCHRLHAFDVLSGQSSLLPFRTTPPRFRCAFGSDPEHDNQSFGHVAQLADVLLKLALPAAGGVQSLSLRGRCEVATLDRVGGLLATLLAAIDEHPQALIGELVNADGPRAPSAINAFAQATFDF